MHVFHVQRRRRMCFFMSLCKGIELKWRTNERAVGGLAGCIEGESARVCVCMCT